MVGIVDEILSAYVEAVDENLQEAGAMLSTAVELQCVHVESVRRLVHILRWEWMDGHNAFELSEEALELLLTRTKNLGSRERQCGNPCLSEYLRFRGVLKWAILSHTVCTGDNVERLIDEAMPVARDKLYQIERSYFGERTLRWLPGYNCGSNLNTIFHFLQIDQSCEGSAVRLLRNIDWKALPLPVPLSVVEPLKLISPARLIDIFRSSHVERPVILHLSWVHGSGIAVLDNGFSIGTHHRSRGLAVCELPNNLNDDLAVWRFTVEKLDHDVQLGSAFWKNLPGFRTWDFDGLKSTLGFIQSGRGSSSDATDSRSRALHMYREECGTNYNDLGEPECGTIYYDLGEPWLWHPLQTQHPIVEFRFSRAARKCSVKVDDQDLGPVWTDLPQCSSFSPALFLEGDVRVRVEIVSGFDFL